VVATVVAVLRLAWLPMSQNDALAALCKFVQVPQLPRPEMAPYNGYGTLLDSEQNCRLLLPKPPKKDLRKMVNKDGMILRFVSKFNPRSEIGFAVRSLQFNNDLHHLAVGTRA
jgi:hypothetical protein